jgi:hypothetical protein
VNARLAYHALASLPALYSSLLATQAPLLGFVTSDLPTAAFETGAILKPRPTSRIASDLQNWRCYRSLIIRDLFNIPSLPFVVRTLMRAEKDPGDENRCVKEEKSFLLRWSAAVMAALTDRKSRKRRLPLCQEQCSLNGSDCVCIQFDCHRALQQ